MKTLVVGIGVLVALAGSVFAAVNRMDTPDELVGTFQWLVGSAIDDLELLPPFGHAAAVADDGSLILISGSGTFALGGDDDEDDDDENSVTGGGTYKIYPQGDFLPDGFFVEGTWTMTDFESFQDFGLDLATGLRGGILEAKIELSDLGEGEIVIVCRLGDFPPGTYDHVTVKTEDLDFELGILPVPSEGGGGLTVFVDMP